MGSAVVLKRAASYEDVRSQGNNRQIDGRRDSRIGGLIRRSERRRKDLLAGRKHCAQWRRVNEGSRHVGGCVQLGDAQLDPVVDGRRRGPGNYWCIEADSQQRAAAERTVGCSDGGLTV